MPTNDQLQATAAVALRDFASKLYTVGGVASLANKPLKVLKVQFKSIETLEVKRDSLEESLTKVNYIAKVFEKVGATKLAGKIASAVTKSSKKKLVQVEKKLGRDHRGHRLNCDCH